MADELFNNNRSVMNNKSKGILVFILLAIFSYALLNSAWLCDDFFISLTQIVNLHNGDGIVFNFQERVQAFTHPTWFFFIALISFVTQEYFYTVMIVSILLSLASICTLIYFALQKNIFKKSFLIFFMLLFSKAFIDFTSSGLENPLSYFLFAILFFLLFINEYTSKDKPRLMLIYILMTLIFLNRMDYSLILLPIFIELIFKYKKENLKPIIVCGSAISSWFLFSLFYFGNFFPNTFFAKLAAGYPQEQYFERALNYYEIQYLKDPITLLIITVAIILSFQIKQNSKSIAIGLILYMLYVFKTGGDFMLGRMFAIPVFISSFLIIYYLSKKEVSLKIINFMAILFILFTLRATSPLFTNKNFNIRFGSKGIADERAWYFQDLGMFSPNKHFPEISRFSDKAPTEVRVFCGALGYFSLSLRDEFFIVDECSLSDPLLAKLPAIQNNNWRVGHQIRKIPENYLEVVVNNDSKLTNNELNDFYQDIRFITHGKLFDFERIKTIVKSKTYDYQINLWDFMYTKKQQKIKKNKNEFIQEHIKAANHKIVSSSKISNTLKPGTYWADQSCFKINNEGLSISFEETKSIKKLFLGLDHNDSYLITYLLNNKIIGTKEVPALLTDNGGLSTREIKLKKKTTMDKISIFPIEGDDMYSIGYLKYE